MGYGLPAAIGAKVAKPECLVIDIDGDASFNMTLTELSTANAFEAMHQAETRSGPQGVLDAAQRMPRAAMLYAYTRNSAQVLNQMSEIGSLAPGKRADLALIDRDVLTVSAEDLKKAAVVFTMFGGTIVYGHEP